MNQDQTKDLMLSLRSDVEEFFLIFSGKQSRKANGVYHPDTREIVIHNRNFENDTLLIYTAIHEFAHHIHFTTSAVPVGPRAHTREFRSILHGLLERAEQSGVYKSPFDTDPAFVELTGRIRGRYLVPNGKLMKELGELLVKADELCRKRGTRFEDYVERSLIMDHRTAVTLMKLHNYDISPEIGYHNMTTVAGIRNEEKRLAAEEAFQSGRSPDSVKAGLTAGPSAREEPLEKLEKERRRIRRTIASLEAKLKVVEDRIREIGDSPGRTVKPSITRSS